MTSKNWIQSLSIVSLIAIHSVAFGWTMDEKNKGKVIPEATEAQLAAAQKMNQTMPEVGSVPERTEDVPDVAIPDDEGSGADVIAKRTEAGKFAGEGGKSGTGIQSASAILQAAEADLKAPKRKPNYTLLYILGTGTIGFLAYAKRWADKNISGFKEKPKRK